MKFEDKFPKMKYLDEEEGMIKGKNPVPCGICGELTLFIDLCSEGPFCSEECMEQFYTYYYEEGMKNNEESSITW